MPNPAHTPDLAYADTLWKAAGATRGQVDFLKYISDAFASRRAKHLARRGNAPPVRPDIATLIDDAILAIERDNPKLKSKLPRDYARRGIAPEKITGLINLIANIGFKGDRDKARDSLGRVYEYFLAKFAQAEGKLGGEFYTPHCIVRLLVEMLEPFDGRVYDPCCGSGGMFAYSVIFANRMAISI